MTTSIDTLISRRAGPFFGPRGSSPWFAAALLIAGNGCVLKAVDRGDELGVGDGDDDDDDGDGDGDGDGSTSDGPGGPGPAEGGGGGETGGEAPDPTPPKPPTEDCQEIQAIALDVLDSNCSSCHNPATNTAGFGYVTNVEQLVLSGKAVPGDAASSPVFKRMAAGSMPPPAAAVRPTGDDIAAVATWIDSCLDATPEACASDDWITTADIVDLLIADASTMPAIDRRFTRYLSLASMHNAGYCAEDMGIFRFAVSKAINSLSLDPTVSPLRAIDPWNTLYRVDLRKYDWERARGVDKWELLVDNNPYAIEFVDDDSRLLQTLLDTTHPVIDAGFFVHDSSLPPLYYDLVEFPPTLEEFEQREGINVDVNIDQLEVARAGFLSSGVASHNRMFEHHQLPSSANRSLWVSYDFATGEGRQNLFAHPLDFVANGGEGIWNLPNGMQAYFVIDSGGNRLDEAPAAIVTDPGQADKVVRAGISCLGCHANGMQPGRDELRPYVLQSADFNQDTKEIVEAIYVSHAEMDTLLETSSRHFKAALSSTWSGATTSIEPILYTFTDFDKPLDLRRAAAELGLPPDSLRAQLGQLDESYAPLVTGFISREAFEAKFAESVCLLNLGLARDRACGFDEE